MLTQESPASAEYTRPAVSCHVLARVPNFIVTNVCNLSCPFCFASEHIDGEQQGGAARMSVAEFQRQLAFIGKQAVRFCGGEPTLHPEFTTLMDLALAKRGRPVYLMTNGVWPTRVRDYLSALGRSDRKRVGYLFNVLNSRFYKPEQERALHLTLQTVHREHATLGVTLFSPEIDYQHVFVLADRFGFKRLRYSVASPTVSDPRSWLVDAKRDFPGLAQIVFSLTMEARRRGMSVQSDCGYLPPCMFTADQLQALYPRKVEGAFSCNGPIDIGPGGQAWRCYGLYSTMKVETSQFANSGELGEYFEARTRETHFVPLFDACSSCELREPYGCAGGCYALRSVNSLQAQADEGLVQLGASFGSSVPRLHKAVIAKSGAVMLREPDDTWSQLPLDAWETALLQACNGERSVNEIARLVDAARPREAVAGRVFRRFYAQAVVEMLPPRATPSVHGRKPLEETASTL